MTQVKLVKNLGHKLRVYLNDRHVERVRNLEGKLLTIIDGSFSDAVQRKAVKDLVSEALWKHDGDFYHSLTHVACQIAVGSGETLPQDVIVPGEIKDNPFVESVE